MAFRSLENGKQVNGQPGPAGHAGGRAGGRADERVCGRTGEPEGGRADGGRTGGRALGLPVNQCIITTISQSRVPPSKPTVHQQTRFSTQVGPSRRVLRLIDNDDVIAGRGQKQRGRLQKERL